MNDLTPTPAVALAADSFNRAFDLFDQISTRFLATKRDRTRKAYRTALTDFRDTCEVGALPPLSGDALIAYSALLDAHRADKGGDMSNDTIRLRLKAVHALFRWAWAFDLSPIKPELIKHLVHMPPARQLSPRDILSQDEATRLLAKAVDPLEKALITVMLSAGLRLSEALALRVKDVFQFDDRSFLNVAIGKGDKGRIVPIALDAYEVIIGYIGADSAIAEKLLFEGLYPRGVQRLVKRIARRAGINKNITPHSLRHTYGSVRRRQGVPVDLISKLLGHSSETITRLYTRPGQLLLESDLPALPW